MAQAACRDEQAGRRPLDQTHELQLALDGAENAVIEPAVIELVGDLDEAQRQRLLEIADRCPVHRTLESDPQIVSELV